jgi:hypothetical protein
VISVFIKLLSAACKRLTVTDASDLFFASVTVPVIFPAFWAIEEKALIRIKAALKIKFLIAIIVLIDTQNN